MDISKIEDNELLKEIGRRFDEKSSSLKEMDFLTKKLLEMNEKSKNAQEVKSQFLSLVKNEFNNPMSSLLNIANMINGTKDLNKIASLGEMLKRELINIDFSLKNIFAASEIEAGEVANEYSKIDMEDIFNEVIDYFADLIEEKHLSVVFENKCKKNIISDSQKLYMILLNLVSNACEYSYPQNEVKVLVQCGEISFKIDVVDRGEGVNAEHTKEIYNRFTHFETGKTRGTAGLGLGLSVAKGMTEAMEGIIDNTTENGKTIFTVTIPFVSEDDINISKAFGSNEFMFEENDGGMVEF